MFGIFRLVPARRLCFQLRSAPTAANHDDAASHLRRAKRPRVTSLAKSVPWY